MKKILFLALAFLALQSNAQSGTLVYNASTNQATFTCSGCSSTYFYEYVEGTANTIVSGSTSSNPFVIPNGGGIKSFKVSNTSSPSTWKDIRVATTGLPVELSIFFGEENCLLWTTQSERQNKGWEIETSIDAKNWKIIGFVNGSNNSTTKIDYTFELKQFGKFYYKMKQIDFDGHYEYSNIILYDNSIYSTEGKVYIDLNGKKVDKPKPNTMYILPNGNKTMFIEN